MIPNEGDESTEGEFAPGTLLSGKFRIIRLIAQGGMGAVYEAEQLALQRRVAIKTLRVELAEDQPLRQRFVREGRVAARVQHPNIVEVIDTGEHETTPYLVMELLDGDDLAKHVKSRGRLTASEAMDLLVPVCAAIATAHDLGVIHRDIKAENVALVKPRKAGSTIAKLVDFGLSKNVLSTTAHKLNITDASAVLGTPLYMPPEAALGPAHLDARSDQYSFAVVIFECLTGRTPFVAPTLSELLPLISKGNPPRPSTLVPNLDPALDAVILRAMHLERARRFSTMWDLGAALLPFASERTRGQWAETFTAGSRRSAHRWTTVGALTTDRTRSATLARSLKITGLLVALALVAAALRWTLVTPRPVVVPTPSERDASTLAPTPRSTESLPAIHASTDAGAPTDATLEDGGAPRDVAPTDARATRPGARRRPNDNYEIF